MGHLCGRLIYVPGKDGRRRAPVVVSCLSEQPSACDILQVVLISFLSVSL